MIKDEEGTMKRREEGESVKGKGKGRQEGETGWGKKKKEKSGLDKGKEEDQRLV